MAEGISIEGDVKKFESQIQRLNEFDKKKLSLTLSEAMRTSTMARFQSETGPDGKKWPQSIRVKDIGGKTLSDTGGLRKSIHAKGSGEGFAVGTNLRYAATHQMGAKDRVIRAKNKKSLRFCVGGTWVVKKKVVVSIPARPYLGIDDDDLEEIEAAAAELLMEE